MGLRGSKSEHKEPFSVQSLLSPLDKNVWMEKKQFMGYFGNNPCVKKKIAIHYNEFDGKRGALVWTLEDEPEGFSVTSGSMSVGQISECYSGKNTPELQSEAALSAPSSCCFSLITFDGYAWHLEAESEMDRRIWIDSLKQLFKKVNRNIVMLPMLFDNASELILPWSAVDLQFELKPVELHGQLSQSYVTLVGDYFMEATWMADEKLFDLYYSMSNLLQISFHHNRTGKITKREFLLFDNSTNQVVACLKGKSLKVLLRSRTTHKYRFIPEDFLIAHLKSIEKCIQWQINEHTVELSETS